MFVAALLIGMSPTNYPKIAERTIYARVVNDFVLDYVS